MCFPSDAWQRWGAAHIEEDILNPIFALSYFDLSLVLIVSSAKVVISIHCIIVLCLSVSRISKIDWTDLNELLWSGGAVTKNLLNFGACPVKRVDPVFSLF